MAQLQLQQVARFLLRPTPHSGPSRTCLYITRSCASRKGGRHSCKQCCVDGGQRPQVGDARRQGGGCSPCWRRGSSHRVRR
jgi:hypothetical protein